MTLATFVRFRVWFEAGSDPNHSVNAGQFVEDIDAPDVPALGQYVQNVFEMADYSGAFGTRERGMFGIHWINTTGGNLDTSWVTADFTAVESAVQTFWTALNLSISSDVRLVEHRWYAYGPGIFKPNPPSRVTTITPAAGGGSPGTVRQNATTVTLRTALRRHWGRFYVPVTSSKLGSTHGQLASSDVDAFAAAARTLLTSPGTSQGVVPVVWDRVHNRAYGVSEIEVDSVPDIIRRRRPRTTGYKKIHTS